jgi:hypothetical protein
VILRPNSRSCRTASIRSGIAGGLAGELGDCSSAGRAPAPQEFSVIAPLGGGGFGQRRSENSDRSSFVDNLLSGKVNSYVAKLDCHSI